MAMLSLKSVMCWKPRHAQRRVTVGGRGSQSSARRPTWQPLFRSDLGSPRRNAFHVARDSSEQAVGPA